MDSRVHEKIGVKLSMRDKEHIVTADKEGSFYCKAADAVLNYNKNQEVCGIGCPCYVSAMDGHFVCRYAEGSFPTVEGLDKRLEKAYRYSFSAHKGQFRKGTKIPYFTHIITTMNYCMELTDDIEILQAAILHDTVEDTHVTFDDLRRDFGARVARIVEDDTEDKLRDMPPEETWEIRKQTTVRNLRNRPIDSKIVVLADKTANAESVFREWKQIGNEVWNKFNMKDMEKHEWYFRSIAGCLTEFYDTSVMFKFMEYIDGMFGKVK